MSMNAPAAHAFGTATVSSSVVAITDLFTDAQLIGATVARCQTNSGGVFCRYDGGNPTNAAGLKILNDFKVIGNQNIRNLKFIRVGTADDVLSVQLERL